MRGVRSDICGNRGCFVDGYRAAVPNLVNIQGARLMHTMGLRHTRAARPRLVVERGWYSTRSKTALKRFIEQEVNDAALATRKSGPIGTVPVLSRRLLTHLVTLVRVGWWSVC